MDLRTAILQVAKVLPKKRVDVPEFFTSIRFTTLTNGGHAVYATDGIRFYIVPLAEPVPSVLLPADLLVKAARDATELHLVSSGYGKIEVQTDISKYQIQGIAFDTYPATPFVPDIKDCPVVLNWQGVLDVAQAAGTEKFNPELAVVSFKPDYVEAMDTARLARSTLPGLGKGLVSASMFKSWPKGEVRCLFSEYYAYFWIDGQELRICTLQVNDSYPDTTETIPAGGKRRMLIQTKELARSIKQGTAVSDLGLVKLEYSGSSNMLTVRAWNESGEGEAFAATVVDLHPTLDPGVDGMALVNGKYMQQAIKGVKTPNAVLVFGESFDPVRIESGAYTVCLWQMAF